MDAEFFKTLGQIAGIGGVALGVFLVLFKEIIRKNIFPKLRKEDAYKLLRLVSILAWSVAMIGIGAWVWTTQHPSPPPSSPAVAVEHGVGAGRDINVNGDIVIEKKP